MKIFLMWNSELLIDGGGDANVETSSLDSSNLIVLKVLLPNVNIAMVGFLFCLHV